jgi:protein-L-isoaspartate(D-aspartate) O-methyltransferase
LAQTRRISYAGVSFPYLWSHDAAAVARITPSEKDDAERMVRFQLEARGIKDPDVRGAMRRVPRSLFVSPGHRRDAYGDFPISIGHGQTISQPYMVAVMTEALSLTRRERVLEIGTGSGYQTAILAELSSQVYSIERIPELLASAERILGDLGYKNVYLLDGDGGKGLPQYAPFDRILVTAAAPSVSRILTEQLADNGIMVVPVGDYRFSQILVIVRKIGGRIEQRESIGCRFVPLVGEGGFEV